MIFLVLIVVCGLPLYFLPTIIAVKRKEARLFGWFCLNLMVGWTAIGWFVLLLMASIDFEKEERARQAQENFYLREDAKYKAAQNSGKMIHDGGGGE